MSESTRHVCPVCGYPKLTDPPRGEHSEPSHEICPSCGFHFGYNDDDGGYTYEQWRLEWLDGGAQFWRTRNNPPGERWIPWGQLAAIGAFDDPGPGPWLCPACGYRGLDEPPRLPDGGSIYDICWCCGFEYGYTDDDQGHSYGSWRRKWIANGMPWTSGGRLNPPPGWDPVAQLRAAGLPV